MENPVVVQSNKSAYTPIEASHKLDKGPKSPPVEKDKYQHLVGKLIYLSHSRPNMTYTMSMVSQFMHNRKELHIEMVT